MNRVLPIAIVCLAALLSSSVSPDQQKFYGSLSFKVLNSGSYVTSLNDLSALEKDKVLLEYVELYQVYDQLKELRLINKPFFYLRIDSLRTYPVYTSKEEYARIIPIDPDELLNENVKIELALSGELIDIGPMKIIRCTRIEEMERVTGKTYVVE